MKVNVILLILLIALPLFAKDSPKDIRQFGDHLFKGEDYYRAITEYKRFLYFHPKHSRANETKLLVGLSYLKGEKWQPALKYFEGLTNHDNRYADEAQFLMGQTHLDSKKYKNAIMEWQNFLHRYQKSPLKNAATYQTAWAHFLIENMDDAQSSFLTLHNKLFNSHSTSMIQEINTWDALPSRSPTLAGIMSAILPGSGQVYTGRAWDGVSAFFINAAFAYGIYETIDREHYVAAGILAIVASGFYGGNILGAVSNAHKFNRRTKDSKFEELKTKHGLKVEWGPSGLKLNF